MKRVNKEGLKEDYTRDQEVGSVVHCLMSLPLLPPREIVDAVSDIEAQLDADSQHASRLQKLIAYFNRQWITKRSRTLECSRQSQPYQQRTGELSFGTVPTYQSQPPESVCVLGPPAEHYC